tara:strand:+ start:4329 stop:4796 length:468 start_codon:yes stop_codon:yes gene_type:complete
MRKIERIILHCSATKEDHAINAEQIRLWHTSPPRNWSDIGYHYVVLLDGTIESGRPINRAGAHTKGQNKDSIGICYVGGLDKSGYPKNTLSSEQYRSINRLCRALCHVINKPLTLHGHREYAKKACPSFEVEEVFANLQKWMVSYSDSTKNTGRP